MLSLRNIYSIKYIILLLFFIFLTGKLHAQDSEQSVTVHYVTESITIDGMLDEPVWERADAAGNFWQYFPSDSIRAENKTRVSILYDDENLYVGIYAETTTDDYVASSLRRDFSGASNDNISVLFDTYRDGSNAFLFGITPYGVQRELLISEGGAAGGLNPSWDVKWEAEVRSYPDHFTAELMIPLTSVKFPENSDQWRFQTYRFNYANQEHSAWARVPQNQLLSSLAFMGTLQFERPLGRSRTPMAIIPYTNVLAQNDQRIDNSDYDLKIGGDAKISVGNNMNLDLTVNPDFSNTEVDAIFTNLTRFEVQLPERRQFFIDNSDLFNSYGSIYGDASPFFSRRIGLARDTTGALIQNRILAGGRLSGKLNENWRLGILNIQTDENVGQEIPSNNNMMLAVQRKVSSRSSIGAFLINRETFANYNFLDPEDEYNRVLGIDYNLASADNSWLGKFYVHKSLQPGDTNGNFSAQATTSYTDRNWYFSGDLVYVDQDFQSDLGFIPRTDIMKLGAGIGRTFYVEDGIINRHSFRLISMTFWKPTLDYFRTDQTWRPEYNIQFKDQSQLELIYRDRYVFLNNDFNPSGKPGSPIPGETGYNFSQLSISYRSNVTSPFTFSFSSSAGQFFNGNSYSYGVTIGYRFQPWASLSVDTRYDQLRMPGDIPDADFWLVTPRAEITFSRSVFWTTLIQYSNQRNNIGINSRLQWRFAPLSDLFLVYNDNYFPDGLSPKFRSINLKVTYWFNIGS